MLGTFSMCERRSSSALCGPMLIVGVGMSMENCENIFLGSFLRCSFATNDHRHFHCDSFVSDLERHHSNWSHHHHPSSSEHHRISASSSPSTTPTPQNLTSDSLCSINFEPSLYVCDSIAQKQRQTTPPPTTTNHHQRSSCLRSVNTKQTSLISTPHHSVHSNNIFTNFQTFLRQNSQHFLLIFLIFLVYWPSLNADLVFDDRPAIVDNQDLRPETPWIFLLFNDYWGTDITSVSETFSLHIKYKAFHSDNIVCQNKSPVRRINHSLTIIIYFMTKQLLFIVLLIFT